MWFIAALSLVAVSGALQAAHTKPPASLHGKWGDFTYHRSLVVMGSPSSRASR